MVTAYGCVWMPVILQCWVLHSSAWYSWLIICGISLRNYHQNILQFPFRIYLAPTKELYKGQKCLFVACKPDHTEIKPAMISLWIAKTVCCVYNNLLEDSAHLFRVRAHDVRAFATSCSTEGLSPRYLKCSSVAFPHHLHLLLPHRPHSC